MKIKQIIIMLFVFLSVIPMTLLGVANMYLNNSKLEKVLENDLKNTVSTQMKAITNFLDERRADADIITRYRLIHNILDNTGLGNNKHAEELSHFIDDILTLRVENNQYVESATILNPDFIVVACSDVSCIGDVSTLKDIDPAYLNPELTFTPVVETQRSGRRSRVIAAVQEIHNEGLLAGYLVLELNLSFFEEIRDSASLYNNGTIYLVDGNNAMIAAGDTISARKHFVLSDEERADYYRAWAERDPDSMEGVLRYAARGNRYLSCYSKFEDTDWMIISSINIDEVLQTRKGYRDLIVQILIVLATLLVAVNYIIRHYIGAPIHIMIDKFKVIEKTKDYSIRMEISGRNEISTISSGINALLASIEQYVQKEHQIQEDLKFKAQRDPLTGLYNKEAFGELLDAELKKARQTDTPIACLFLDIDDFKDFNTNHGHSGGDKVLLFIAEALHSQIGELACRQGGDEFTVCITDASDRGRIKAMVLDLMATLNHGLRFHEKDALISVHCSIGIVFSDEHTVSGSQLIERSDEAMYVVKNDEKNGCLFWE